MLDADPYGTNADPKHCLKYFYPFRLGLADQVGDWIADHLLFTLLRLTLNTQLLQKRINAVNNQWQ